MDVTVDGPPGIGCPVISSLSGADLVVLVDEPAATGNRDLQQLVELISEFRIEMVCIVNKYDINTQKTANLKSFLLKQGITHLADIPFDDVFTHAMIEGNTLAEMPSPVNDLIKNAWLKIMLKLESHC